MLDDSVVKRRVLAVDDEEEILRLYESFLRYRGFEVVTMSTANECLAVLATDVADVLLLDVNMPGVDGLRLLEMVRTDDRHRDMRVIMITARRDESTVRAAAQLGCDSFIVKPFKLKELGERINLELFSITDAELRAIFSGHMVIRTGMHKEPGLSDLDPLQWDPYVVKYRDVSLCMLVPRGVRPLRFSRAPVEELEKRVVVYFRHPQRWKKVWPPHRG